MPSPPSRRVPALAASACLAVMAVMAMILGASCSSADWDTGASEADVASTTQKLYSRDEAGVTESLVDHLSTVGSNLNEWAAPVDQATCAAQRIVERLGVDRLLAAGYDPQVGRLALSYTPDERTAVTNILVSCIDFKEGLLEMFAAYAKLELTPAACLARGIDRLGLTRDIVAGLLDGAQPDPFQNDNRLAAGISRLQLECLDPQKDLLPVAPQDPFPQDRFETTTTVPPTSAPEGDAGGGESPSTTAG